MTIQITIKNKGMKKKDILKTQFQLNHKERKF